MTEEEAQAFAEENGLSFIETSAQNGKNIDKIFELASINLLKKINLGDIVINEAT